MEVKTTSGVTAERGRTIYIDLLRIIACFSVVVLHSASQFWYDLPVTDTNWLIGNSYNALVRFGVPIFVMISGAIFLAPGKEISIKRLYIHNILRMVIIYILWNGIYGLFDCRKYDWSLLSPRDVITEMAYGRYHLWFLAMIIGLYMLVPILRKWLLVAEEKDVRYFLVLFVVFQIGKETFFALQNNLLTQFLSGLISIEMVCSYVGYFVLGYYVVHYDIASKWYKWIYLGGILGAVLNVLLGNALALRRSEPSAAVYDSYSVFTFFMALSIFLLVKQCADGKQWSGKTRTIISEVSGNTMGVYLMHILMLEWGRDYNVHSMMISPIIGIPLISFGCFVICLAVSAVLRRLPLIGRYIC